MLSVQWLHASKEGRPERRTDSPNRPTGEEEREQLISMIWSHTDFSQCRVGILTSSNVQALSRSDVAILEGFRVQLREIEVLKDVRH